MPYESISQILGEPTVVTGVVHLHGTGGVKAGSEQEWILQFAFEIWRGVNGVLNPGKLAIRRQVTKDELHLYMNRIRPYKILSARVSFTGPASAQLVELLGQIVDEHDALMQHATKLLTPKQHQHERFGILTLDRSVDWYVATTIWEGENMRLNLSATDDSALDAALRTAVELWEFQSMWNQRIREYAVQKLLTLKNSAWLEDDENELTPDDFKGRMRLEAVTVSPDGSFDFWYDDGDLFWGHMIQVSGNLRDGPIDADIPG